MFVFAYGSLMSPDSLLSVLPDTALSACVPARSTGRVRKFGVAFPNDGSQKDKAYFDVDGNRPAIVLLCDIPRAEGRWLNGVCVPVDDQGIAALERRELRYELFDVTARTTGYFRGKTLDQVVAFVGAEKFTRAADIEGGVLHDEYLETIQSGARHWESVCRGFYDDFVESTVLPAPSQIRPLKRVDAVPDTDPVMTDPQ
jgi:hypothetical protein